MFARGVHEREEQAQPGESWRPNSRSARQSSASKRHRPMTCWARFKRSLSRQASPVRKQGPAAQMLPSKEISVIPEAAERGWQGSGLRRSEPMRRSFPGGGGQASDPVRDLPVRRVGKRSSSRVSDPIQQSFEGLRSVSVCRVGSMKPWLHGRCDHAGESDALERLATPSEGRCLEVKHRTVSARDSVGQKRSV